MHFLAALLERGQQRQRPWSISDGEPLHYRSAREAAYVDNDRKQCPIYLARAEGHLFDVVQRL